MRRDFEQFKTKQEFVPKIDDAYSMEYFVFQLAEGDATKIQEIKDTVSFEDGFLVMMFRQYEAYCKELLMKSNGR